MLNRKRVKRRDGFTLIELLVVISIISLLISILIPSLRKAREQARDTQCLSRLRAVFIAHAQYINDHNFFPPLNNEEDDGAWQYNYLIHDGQNFANNFGPLVEDTRSLEYIRQLFCPVQTDPYHSLSTQVNPWPIQPPFKTRSSYGRRYHLSGRSLSDFRATIAFAADVLHLPSVIRTAHKDGVNAVYTDGHARWVKDPGLLTDNELSNPFDIEGNEIMEDIWDVLDEAN